MVRKRCEEHLFDFIFKFRLLIILFWIGAGIISCFWALDLPNYTLFQFLPPDGTQSAHAYHTVKKYFPSFLFQDIEIILISYKYQDALANGSENEYKTILNPITKQLCNIINETMYTQVDPNGEMLEGITQLYQFNVSETSKSNTHQNPSIPMIEKYSKDLNEYIYDSSKSHFVSSDESLMVVLLTLNVDGFDQQKLNNYISKIESNLNSIISRKSPMIDPNYVNMYDLTLTGGLTIFQEAMAVIKQDITGRDLIVLPFIFLFMVYIVCRHSISLHDLFSLFFVFCFFSCLLFYVEVV